MDGQEQTRETPGVEAAVCRFRITVAYDGTGYAGWQMQPGSPTVQETLQAALQRLSGEDIKVNGSGRTDAGVHARGQVAHFDMRRPFEPAALQLGLNACLPPDIRVLGVAIVSADFHARRHAVGKEYRYFIWNAPVLLPTARYYHLHIPQPLDVGAMQAAAVHLVGRHDFAAFSANPSRFVETTVRTVHALSVTQADEEIVIAIRGEGFLYKMVRSITGWLIRVGLGDVSAAQTAAVLASCERTARVPSAPPQGLFLWSVSYPEMGSLRAVSGLQDESVPVAPSL